MSEKLELKDILGALDLGAREVWDELSEEQKKSVAFFLLNRYMSCGNCWRYVDMKVRK